MPLQSLPDQLDELDLEATGDDSFRSLRFFGFAIVCGLLVIGLVGWLIHDAVEQSFESTLTEELQAVLDANEEAVRLWMTSQEEISLSIAASPGIRNPLVQLLATDQAGEGNESSTETLLIELTEHLSPQLQIHGYDGFVVLDEEWMIVASDQEKSLGRQLDPPDLELAKHKLSVENRSCVSVPYHSEVALLNHAGRLQAGVPTMLSFAPIEDDVGQFVGVLGLRIHPEKDFSPILSVARAGTTGETFAYDRTGLLLTDSRFDAELRKLGELTMVDGESSALNLKIRGPMLSQIPDNLENPTSSDIPMRHATNHYRYLGYRDEEVVGVWKWIDDYGFGLATEQDVSEAFESYNFLWRIVAGLYGLVVMGTALIGLILYLSSRARHQIAQRIQSQASSLAEEMALREIRARSQFFGNLENDLRAPLRSILETSDLALQSDVSQRDVNYFSSIRNSAQSLKDVIDDVLDFNQTETEQFDFQRVAFDFREILHELFGPLELAAHIKRKSFSTRIDDTIPTVITGDVDRLQQVVRSLVIRALDFANCKGVDLSFTNEELTSEHVVICMSTTMSGPTSIASHLRRIFKHAGGVGRLQHEISRDDIGIVTAVRLSNLAGAQIDADVVDDLPTISLQQRFLIPRSVEDLQDGHHSMLPTGSQVLFAHSSRAESEVLALLGDLNVRLITRSIPDQEGIATIDSESYGSPIEFVIVDVDHHETQSCVEFCRRVRANPDLASTPMMIVTDPEDLTLFEEFQTQSMTVIVAKPLTRPALESGIRTVVLGPERAMQLRRDLESAEQYVRSLIPSPISEPVRIDWKYVPANDLAGDSLGFHLVDENRLAVYVIDAVGHGIDACLLSVSILDTIKSQSLPETDFRCPDQVLSGLNRKYQMEDHADRCFTIWYGVLNLDESSICWSGGGHPPAILFDQRDGNPCQELPSTGPMIGMLEEFDFSIQKSSVNPGSRIYLFTDGVFEISLTEERLWTQEEFLAELVEFNNSDTPLDKIWRRALELRGQPQLEDDFTILMVDF